MQYEIVLTRVKIIPKLHYLAKVLCLGKKDRWSFFVHSLLANSYFVLAAYRMVTLSKRFYKQNSLF